jgi:phage replication-related protein YjqB (UPF0714/DUF867 family)
LFATLLAHPGVEEDLRLGSRFGLMAYHGGNLEVATDTIAADVADRTGASLYAVRQPPDLRWHIPSTEVRPTASERLAQFLDHVEIVITVHGFGRDGYWTRLLLGGTNRALATHVGSHLRQAVAPHGYEVIDEINEIPAQLRGLHPANPVNVPPAKGVQLELPPRVRGTTPLSKPEHTAALIEGLVAAVESWPNSG